MYQGNYVGAVWSSKKQRQEKDCREAWGCILKAMVGGGEACRSIVRRRNPEPIVGVGIQKHYAVGPGVGIQKY